MKKPYAVVFAGPSGSSKSIIAHHLSVVFNLPVLTRDIIRSEVKEELLVDNINIPRAHREFEKRYNDRFSAVLAAKQSIIIDSSVDRCWDTTKPKLLAAGYEWFLISMEMSREFFVEMFTATRRPKGLRLLDGYLADHRRFMERFGDQVDLKIDDKTFNDRLKLSVDGLNEFLASHNIK